MEIFTWPSIAEERLTEQITRKMFRGANILVAKWEFAPGTALPVHDHVCEHVTMVRRGELAVLFPDEADVKLRGGEMIVIPAAKPHGVKAGPEGCSVIEVSAPVSCDFTGAGAGHKPKGDRETSERTAVGHALDEDPYRELQGFLESAGIKIPLEKLVELPLELLARYVYERECISMGQLRRILRIDKTRAKELLAEWKHGDDHGEASLRRKLERLVILPNDRHSP